MIYVFNSLIAMVLYLFFKCICTALARYMWLFAGLRILVVGDEYPTRRINRQAAHRLFNLPSAYIQTSSLLACAFHEQKGGAFMRVKFHRVEEEVCQTQLQAHSRRSSLVAWVLLRAGG